MIKQSDIFLQGEGRNWMKRNEGKIDVKNDPILKMIEEAELKPQRVLEIGCADGWRLRELDKRYRCHCHGIDPYGSNDETMSAFVDRGTADDLAVCFDEDYDLVIYGFCLYLCDREDLFRIAMEGDRVLADKGHMIIWDFDPVADSYKRPYSHDTRLFSYKMDYSQLWTGNPAYERVAFKSQNGEGRDDNTVVALLRKDMEAAWPTRSF